MKKLLNEFDSIEVIHTYTSPDEVLKNITVDNPDAIFLDIEMPEMNGIRLAKEIKKVVPNICIVFVTSYEKYAVKAFEIYATDYILKPISYERLKLTISRIFIECGVKPKKVRPSHMISTFQSLSFVHCKNKNEKMDVTWRTTKVRGVFIYLLHHREKLVLKDTLLDLFWPNLELKNGYNQLYSTIYQLRKTLSDIDVAVEIVNLDNGYKLRLHDVKLDVDIWDKQIAETISISKQNYSKYRALLDLYQGDYLQDEEYIWLEGERERLKISWINLAMKLANYLEAEHKLSESISLYVLLLSKTPYFELPYFKLMQLYSTLGDRPLVDIQYKKLCNMLHEHYDGTQPSPDVLKWYEEWKQSNAI